MILSDDEGRGARRAVWPADAYMYAHTV